MMRCVNLEEIFWREFCWFCNDFWIFFNFSVPLSSRSKLFLSIFIYIAKLNKNATKSLKNFKLTPKTPSLFFKKSFKTAQK